MNIYVTLEDLINIKEEIFQDIMNSLQAAEESEF